MDLKKIAKYLKEKKYSQQVVDQVVEMLKFRELSPCGKADEVFAEMADSRPDIFYAMSDLQLEWDLGITPRPLCEKGEISKEMARILPFREIKELDEQIRKDQAEILLMLRFSAFHQESEDLLEELNARIDDLEEDIREAARSGKTTTYSMRSEEKPLRFGKPDYYLEMEERSRINPQLTLEERKGFLGSFPEII